MAPDRFAASIVADEVAFRVNGCAAGEVAADVGVAWIGAGIGRRGGPD